MKQFVGKRFNLNELKWYKEWNDPNCGPAEDMEMERNDCGCLTDDIDEVTVPLRRCTTQMRVFICGIEQKATL